jgi:hypothetical protein
MLKFLHTLILKLFTRKPATLDANYWNDKWKKSPITYNARCIYDTKNVVAADVRNFIFPSDVILQKIISDNNLQGITFHDTVQNVQRWAVKNFHYIDDQSEFAVPEFWQMPFETIDIMVGDCEDVSFVIASLLRNAGIPAFRVKVACGNVQPSSTAPAQGHCYCLFLADDNEWRIIDWCYLPDPEVTVSKKPLAADGGNNNCYKEVSFTFNDEFSWAGGAITILDARVKK